MNLFYPHSRAHENSITKTLKILRRVAITSGEPGRRYDPLELRHRRIYPTSVSGPKYIGMRLPHVSDLATAATGRLVMRHNRHLFLNGVL